MKDKQHEVRIRRDLERGGVLYEIRPYGDLYHMITRWFDGGKKWGKSILISNLYVPYLTLTWEVVDTYFKADAHIYNLSLDKSWKRRKAILQKGGME